jgi:phosphoribosylformylglycinamidine synthase PurS subunit
VDGTDEKAIRRDAEQMCQRLLTNPVIHQYDISVKKTS